MVRTAAVPVSSMKNAIVPNMARNRTSDDMTTLRENYPSMDTNVLLKMLRFREGTRTP